MEIGKIVWYTRRGAFQKYDSIVIQQQQQQICAIEGELNHAGRIPSKSILANAC